jgi:hypothetical protein
MPRDVAGDVLSHTVDLQVIAHPGYFSRSSMMDEHLDISSGTLTVRTVRIGSVFMDPQL